MPFYIVDTEWRARRRDGIPGQSPIHRPAMEGSDNSSSDDGNNEIQGKPRRNRLSKKSYRTPQAAVEEHRRRQLEEVIVATTDFDTFSARYPPEAIPKSRPYNSYGSLIGHPESHLKLGREPRTSHDPSSTAASIESQAADGQLETAHFLYGHVPTPPYSKTEPSPRPKRHSHADSTVGDFVQWPAPSQSFTASSRAVDVAKAKKSKRLVSAARKFFTRLWKPKSPQYDTETSSANSA